MVEFLIGFAVFGLAGLGLFLGVLFGRPPLKGSCGGNALVKMCPVCKPGDLP